MVLHGAILLTGPANTKAIVERQDPPGRLSKLNLRQWGRAVGSQADQVAESALCGIGRDAFSNVVALHHAFAQLRQPGPARIWRNLFGCDQWAAKEELEPFDDMSGMVMVHLDRRRRLLDRAKVFDKFKQAHLAWAENRAFLEIHPDAQAGLHQ